MAFRLVETADEARQCLAAIADRGGRVGLDLETTGLDPLLARPRLLQVAADSGPVLVVDLFKAGGLEPLRGELERLRAVAHNAVFDAAFLRRAGIEMVPDCTMLAAHALTGRREKLSTLVTEYLDLPMEKALQTADWGGELSAAHLRYAALDALATLRLWHALAAEMAERGCERAYALMRDAQPAVVQMHLVGMPFDVAAQRELVARLAEERERLRSSLERELGGRNPNSGPQLSDWLAEALGGAGSLLHDAWPRTAGGWLSTAADALKREAPRLPPRPARVVTELLLPYKLVEKRLSAFGAGLERHVHPVTGRVHASFHLAGTVTGRMSASAPNLQQVPREPEFRRLFKAPPGRLLVIADYSQMELRVAALLAGEARLLEAYRRGEDTHRLTAGMILGKAPEAVTKGERQLAKAVNFGLLYGQGARGLRAYAASSYGVDITEGEAERYRQAWFAAYPAIGEWHAHTALSARRHLAVRTPAGRERRWSGHDRAAPGGFRETEAYNAPVQGGAAEVVLAALGELTRALASAGLDAAPVAVVHDEIVVEAAREAAETVRALVERSMVAGMLAVFPEAATESLVESRVDRSWAGT